jgi:hypothetical protein
MKRISYHVEKRDTGYAAIRRTEWPDRKGCQPIDIQINFTQSTEEDALRICANDADWQKVAAEASAAIEIIHPKTSSTKREGRIHGTENKH